MALLFNPNDKDLKKKLQALQPTTGYCVIADMVGSTSLKDTELPAWASTVFNTFSLIGAHIPFPPLKSMGDALMFYIPDAELGAGKLINSALQLFLGLCFVVQEEEEIFGHTKIAITHCDDAYELTFMADTRDIYGKDIDLTARLLSVASDGEIIMNEPFVERVRNDYDCAGNKADFPDVLRIAGPWQQKFKGFAAYVHIYKVPAGGDSLRKASSMSV